MSFDQQALFYQTDLTQWNTLFPIDCITNCLEPPIEHYQHNLFFRKFLSSDKLLKQFNHKTSNKYPWKIELSPDGLMIVILKNNNVELRSSKLDFNHSNFHCQIYRDIYPQWRCVSWSNLSNYFGVSFSNGMCNIWDIHGSRLVFKYSKLNDFDPVIKLIITNIGKNRIKVFIISLKGRILIYIIDNLKITSHSESFCDFLSTPILCCDVSLHRNLLVLGTYNQSNPNEACKNGIVSCRFIDEEPFIVSNVPKNEIFLRKSWISTLFRKNSVDGVYVIRISKDDKKLAAIHLSGILTIWQYPSMKILIKWNSSADLTNQILTPDFISHKMMPENFSDYSIFEICWWNNEHVVIALQNGRIIILNTDKSNSGNIYLNPFPQIQESMDKSFFSLNCTSKYTNKELNRKNNNISIIESFPLKIWKSIFGNILKFLIQDHSSNYFKKNLEMCSLNFQLSCFKLTTPEELFDIQIKKKQYSEALELADKYNLDSDIVFQKQWRDSDKTIEDIEKILIRINKRNWILNECIERIPSHIESMKYLLKLGLELTRFTELENCAINHNRCENINVEIDENFSRKFCEREEFVENVESVNVSELSLVQIELVRIRLKLLSYCDKLCLYENIIQSTNSSFQWQLFQEFKNLSPFELAIKFANSGSIIELEILLKFFNSNLKEHILVILSNIPECLEPKIYTNLFNYLPMFEIENNKNKSNSESTREQLDWCETESFQLISNSISFENETHQIFYQNHPDLTDLRLDITDNLNCQSIFTKWSNMRIRNIEEKTLNAEYALEFLNFIKSFHNITIEEDLEFNLRFLCEAVYNCQIVNTFLSLSEFVSMSYFEKAKLLMSKTDNDRFLIHFDRWIIPFLQEINAKSSIKSLEFFEIYLQYLGCNFLICTRKILEDKDCLNALLNIIDFEKFIQTYLNILLNDDEISNINECGKISRLLGSLISVKSVSNPDKFISEEKQLQEINNYISILRMMEKYELHKTIKFIDTNKMNGEIVENLITNMVFQYLKSVKNLNKITVKSVFTEIQISMSIVFKSIHPKLIYKNLLKSLLESGDKKKINLASEFMDLTRKLSRINDVNSEDKLLDFNEATICICTAAQNYINTSTSCKDSNFQLAKYCFNLLHDSNEEIENELNLIKCCEFLEKYNCSLVPIEVRSVTDRFELLKNCLENNKSLYRNLEEIVEAAGFLCSDKKTNKKFNQGEALRLAGQKALINNDMEILEIVIASLIHRNHKPCWKECVKCIQYSEFPFEKKLDLGKYALTYCPKSEMRNIIKLIKQIELESSHLLDIPNTLDVPSIQDSNTNSTLMKQPIKFLSSNLTDISSKLSLKSLIDKSSDTLMKISNQVIQLGGQGNIHEFYRNIDNKELCKMTFNLIYQDKGTFEFTNKQNPEFNSLMKIFTMSSLLPTFEKQSEIDQIHLKLLKFHLNSDTYLSLIHSIFIDDLNLIYNLRHDFVPNLFNRALILSMIKFNLISKYTFQDQFSDLFQINLSSISEKLSENELSIVKTMEQEFKDYYFLDQISKFCRGIGVSRFFSSVDYREEIIFKLCEFLDDNSVESFRYALQMGSRYGINRRILLGKYLKSFICKIDSSKKINFEEKYAIFQSIFDWTCLMEDQDSLRKDLEIFVISNKEPHIGYFQIILNIFQSIDCEFMLFDKSIKDHIRLMELYDSIYSKSTTDFSYLHLIIGPEKRIIEALKAVINVDNLESCSQLMNEFNLSEQFLKIKNDFSGVLANQALWSNEILTGDDFTERFNKSLENFSFSDYNNCKDFIYSTLFEKSKLYIDLVTKINVLKIAQKYVIGKCECKSAGNEENEWSKVNMEIIIWLDHIENSVTKVVDQLRSMNNISDEIISFAEYLPPENYWDCLMNEMLLCRVSYQNFFTFTWELNIESLIIDDVLAEYISHILFSKFVSTESVLDQLNQIFDEFDEYLDSESIENIITTILTNSKLELKSTIIQWLLNEIIYRIRRNKSTCKFDLNTHIINVISQWKIPFNKKLEISKSNNIFIIDSLIQDCDSPAQMIIIAKVIELIELVHEDNNLWQCWVKCCIIKGNEYANIIYEQFSSLKANKLYKDRFTKLSKDAIQSLICFNSSEAISLLILKDPVESVDQIQTILTDLKSDPTEYTNTMKNINKKSLKIIVDSKLIPDYAKTILFQRLVNFITKEQDDSNIVQDVIDQLKNKGFHDEASWLASSSTHSNPAMKTIEMVSGFWKRFSTGGNS